MFRFVSHSGVLCKHSESSCGLFGDHDNKVKDRKINGPGRQDPPRRKMDHTYFLGPNQNRPRYFLYRTKVMHGLVEWRRTGKKRGHTFLRLSGSDGTEWDCHVFCPFTETFQTPFLLICIHLTLFSPHTDSLRFRSVTSLLQRVKTTSIPCFFFQLF